MTEIPKVVYEDDNIKSLTIGGLSFSIPKRKPFLDTIDINEVKRLRRPDREKVFLKWKWFTNDYDNAKACESTKRGLLKNINEDTLSQMSDGERWYWRNQLDFESRCIRDKRAIGLFEGDVKPPEDLQKIAETVGGVVESWDE